MAQYIPSNPVLDFGALLDGRKLSFPAPGLFSVARHALTGYLHYLSSLRPKPVKNILVPDYMCHEVNSALRQSGFKLARYGLTPDLDATVDSLEAAARGVEVDALILTHFYGRMTRQLPEIAAWCRGRGIALIEDCVHLPFPYHAEYPLDAAAETSSDARLFTLRKVYPVPLGATIVLRNGQEPFARFIDTHIGRSYPDSRLELWKWAGKQLVKKGLLWTGMGYRQRYQDLSDDPLKTFNFLPAERGRWLSVANHERAVRRRRENYRRYLRHATSWGRRLDFTPLDVPYMMVIFLRPELEPLALVQQLMARGVPAALGLALDSELLQTLPAGHPYRRILSLPIHQDISESHIDRIGGILAEAPPETN